MDFLFENSDFFVYDFQTNQTALHCACEVGNVEIVEFLVGENAKIFLKDLNEFTPFLTACYNGNMDCANQIVGRLNDVDQTDKVSYPPCYVSFSPNFLLALCLSYLFSLVFVHYYIFLEISGTVQTIFKIYILCLIIGNYDVSIMSF